MAHVAHYAHYLSFIFFISAPRAKVHLLPDRVTRGKKHARGRLTDQQNAGGTQTVGIRERPSLPQGNAERSKIIRRGPAQFRRWLVLLRYISALHAEAAAPVIS